MTLRFSLLSLFLAACLISYGCAVQTPAPTPAQAPQYRVLQWDRAFADAVNVAAKTTTTLLDAKNIDLATANQVKTWATAAAKLSDDVAAEAQSTDSWTTMRSKLLVLLTSSAISNLPTQNADLKASLSNALGLFQNILKEVQ